jgi:hypothetical protein
MVGSTDISSFASYFHVNYWESLDRLNYGLGFICLRWSWLSSWRVFTLLQIWPSKDIGCRILVGTHRIAICMLAVLPLHWSIFSINHIQIINDLKKFRQKKMVVNLQSLSVMCKWLKFLQEFRGCSKTGSLTNWIWCCFSPHSDTTSARCITEP